MGKDFWGGMFDFNGDGKTTWDEEMLGLSLLEEDRKRTAKNLESKPTYKYKEPKTKSIPTIKAVPEVVDETNYKILCSDYRTECICAVVALILMLIPAILILWAVYSTYDPKNSASDFITIVFTLAGLAYGGVVLHTTFKSINTSMENLNLVKERYTGPKLPKKKSKAAWLLLLLIPLFIGSCFLFSSKDDTESNKDYSYNNGYSYSGYSNNTYSYNYSDECILSHCDFKAKEGSPYCSRHEMDAVTKKTLWYTAVIHIIVPNLVAVCTDMITLAASIAKLIMFITITTNNTLNKQRGIQENYGIILSVHLIIIPILFNENLVVRSIVSE